MRLDLPVALAILLQTPEPVPAPLDAETAAPAETSPRTLDGHRIKEPQKTKNVPPEWPANALHAGLDGAVVLECVLGTDGSVESVKLLKGYRSLADAATAAVRRWHYTPTELDGKPVRVIMTVTVNFKLQGPPRREDVLRAARDADPEVRWAAVRWLGRFRPAIDKQKAAVERALQDPSELVRDAAKQALEKLEATK